MWRLFWMVLIAAGCEPARVGPPQRSSGTVVLRYQDFGPQVMAYELIGYECYSPPGCCCVEPDRQWDIRVVVKDGVRDAVKTGPVRTIDTDAARDFVDAHIAELTSWPAEDRLPELEATLRATRERLHASIP